MIACTRSPALRVVPIALALGACRTEMAVDTDRQPVIVLWTVDTLGATAAHETAWCERLTDTLAPYGRDVGCADAVSPSSWTGEAHTRVLWPEHLAGGARRELEPRCGSPSLHETLGRAVGARVWFGADNPMLHGGDRGCGIPPIAAWNQDARFYTVAAATIADLAHLPEAERPASLVLGDVLAAVAGGDPAVVFLNSAEVGGHFPRCWFDPETPDCRAMWAIAQEARVVGTGADPATAWLDERMEHRFLDYVSDRYRDRPEQVAPLFWRTMDANIEHLRGRWFDDRLVTLLDALQAADRLDDLVLVVWGDHGETPCEVRPVGTGELTCAHGGVPNEFTANVPVFVSPASALDGWRAQGLAGGPGEVWSLGNLGQAMLADLGETPPRAWPDPEPVGSATSLTCRRQNEDDVRGPAASLVHVEGDVAIRCQAEDCVYTSWRVPDSYEHAFDVLPARPDALATYDASFLVPTCGAEP